MNVMRPKSKGSGIMVSDFVEERGGYLALTKEQYDVVKGNNPSVTKNVCSDKFMNQIRHAVKMVEVKYPKNDGWHVAWIFDHSSCHSAMPDDALDVSRMNVNPGGKQRE